VSSSWVALQVVVLIALSALLFVAVSNLFTLRILGTYPPPKRTPKVSVLVPARNEELNIGPCVRSLLNEDYANFEVLALDDSSRDRTGEILAELAQSDARLKVLKGTPLPTGWIGKHWACHQLAEVATGEYLLFTDADTKHSSTGIRDAVAAMEAEQADLLSALPREDVGSWAEQLIVPMIAWSIFAFLPLALAYRVRMPMLSSNIGQFMVFRRSAYEAVGGYAAVRQEVVDDIALGQLVKAHGLRWRLADGQPAVRCRMYRNFREVRDGFSKNMFASLGSNIPFFLIGWLCQVAIFLSPPVTVLLALAGITMPPLAVALAAISVFLSLALWAIYYSRFGFPLYLTFIYPLSVMFSFAIALRSMVVSLRGQASWKDRPLERQKVKLW
jgi:chlorobactene glucosyltransferase